MTDAEADVCEVSFPRFGIRIDKWLRYRVNSQFTTPSDGFDLEVARKDLDDTTLSAIENGEEIAIRINGHTQAQGYIDRVSTRASRESGTIVCIEGSDKIAQVVRAGVDPEHAQFAEGQTLLDAIKTLFGPFGYTEDNILVSNDTNRNLRSGQVRGQKVSKKGKTLKSFTLHQLKAYPNEGVFAYASRLSQRHGLWIWLSAEGNVLIVSRPNFRQPPRYRLFDKRNGEDDVTNILHGEARKDSSQQPSCIVATGFSFGGEADRSHLKVIAVNELVAMGPDKFAVPAVAKIISDHQDASQLPLRDIFPPSAIRPHPAAQPLYLHDQESQTLDQLQNFARRELALRQKEALHVSYTVPGHDQNGTIWCVDTIVDVDDDARNIHEPLWVLGRTFEKSRNGTFTHLEVIRPFTLSFGDLSEE